MTPTNDLLHDTSNDTPMNLYLDSDEDVINDFIKRISANSLADEKHILNYTSIEYVPTPTTPVNFSSLSNAYIRICKNHRFPFFYMVDVVFPDSDNAEIKLFWAKLQAHLRNTSTAPEKDWFFYLEVIENNPELNGVLVATICNPILAYLTREVPNQAVAESDILDGTPQGGNMVRLLVPDAFLQFELQNSPNS